jgi:hypothetical protein
MSGLTIHTTLNVRGALEWTPTLLRGLLHDENGDELSPGDARNALFEELSKGHEFLPIGEPCEGFSYATGCPGHERPNLDAIFAPAKAQLENAPSVAARTPGDERAAPLGIPGDER